jgi:hypothetical protein
MRAWRSLSTVLLAALVVSWTGQAMAVSPSLQAPDPTPSSAPATDPLPAPGFPTPEDAVRAYMSGVANADADRILRATAIEEVSSAFRFDLSAERLNAMLLFDSLAPADYPFYADVNRAMQSARVLRQVQMLAYSLLSSEKIDGTAIVPVDRARAEAFISEVDPSRLGGLTIADIRFPNAKFEHATRYLATSALRAGTYGADELTERMVLFGFEGKLYDVGFTLLRYGEGWKVLEQDSALGGTDSLGTAQPTTAEDFDRLTAGD